MDRAGAKTLVRVSLILIGILATVLAVGSWAFAPTPSTEAADVVRRFTELLDKGDADGAAALTSYPNAAKATITQLFDGMRPGTAHYQTSQLINLEPGSAYFTLNAAWAWGADEHSGQDRDWAYSVQGRARKLSVGWRILWDPTILAPGLGKGNSVRFVRTFAAPPPRVLDVAGGPLMDERTINVVQLDPTRTADRAASAAAVANAIEPVAPLITAASLGADLDAAQGKPVTAVSLRDDDYAVLEPRLASIPGVVTRPQPKLVAQDRRLFSPVLDALRAVHHDSQQETSGWAVQLFDPAGAPVGQYAGYQGAPGPNITSSLDTRLQLAAEDAVVSVGVPAEIVAIRPSDGALVAVAQNNQASEGGPVAFTRMYPAGGNLDYLRAGVDRGDVDGALSCLGIGAALPIPGVDAITGHKRASGLFDSVIGGQDRLQMSPYGMAVVAATIARGTMPTPAVALGHAAPAPVAASTLPDSILTRLRDLMRTSTDAPDAAPVRALPGAIGYTAYAGSDQWFVGMRGDLAFAVHISNAVDEGSDGAARMAAKLLKD